MALDFGKLKGLQKELVDRTNLDSDIVQASKLGEEYDIRVLPPVPELNGVYCLEQIIYWIKGKPYTSLENFGVDCPITQEINAAKLLNDPDLNELLNDDKQLKKKGSWLVPCLILEIVWENDGVTPKSMKVKEGKARALSCGPQLLKAINREATSRSVLPDFTDRVGGTNIIITKEGEGLKTEYSARAWPNRTDMSDAAYNAFYDPTKTLNVVKLVEGFRKSEGYLRGIIRNYLYGEPMPKEEKGAAVTSPAPAAAAAGRRRDESADQRETRTAVADAAPAPRRAPAADPAPAAAPAGRRAAASPAPAAGRRAAAPAAAPAHMRDELDGAQPNEEDDDNDLPFNPPAATAPAAGTKKRGAAPAAAATNEAPPRAAPRRRNLGEDLTSLD